MSTDEPAVNAWQDATGLSTSARLRRAEAELGSALGALDKVIHERNVAWAQLANAEQIIRGAHERAEQARAELAAVSQAHWIVARDGGRNCERCAGEITRGQAYELADVYGNSLNHIHCKEPK